MMNHVLCRYLTLMVRYVKRKYAQAKGHPKLIQVAIILSP